MLHMSNITWMFAITISLSMAVIESRIAISPQHLAQLRINRRVVNSLSFDDVGINLLSIRPHGYPSWITN